MGEPAKEKKRNGGVKKDLLWKPKTNTDWVALQRLRFLDKAMKFPGAKEKLDRLLDAEILELARQDFEEDPTNRTPSIAIVNAIETWAIDAGLARKPVEDYWIFEMAINRLRDLVHGPETAVFCRTGLAEVTLDSLLDSETLDLAQRDFGGKPNGPASMALENKFETWAVGTAAVRKPVDDHWICDPLMNMLRELVRAPKNAISIRDKMAKVIQDNLPDSDSSLILGNWSGEWSTTCDLSLKQVKNIKSFTCGEWEPCAESEVDYRETVKNALEEYLKDVRVRYDEAGFMPGVTRDDKHFEWLVRYHMLSESYEDIAASEKEKAEKIKKAANAASVKTAISQLRSILVLPSRRSPGRPKKVSS